jgi:hypothetical protein
MDTTPVLSQLASLLTVLITLSVATERLVAILQNLNKFLRTEQTTEAQEGSRRAALQALAVVAGIITACLAKEALPTIALLGLKGAATSWPVLGLLGLLASGGSGFWTSILGYVNGLKETQKNIAITTKVQAAMNVVTAAAGTTAPPTANAMAAKATGNSPGTVQGIADARLARIIEVASTNL